MKTGWEYKKLGEVITPAKVCKNKSGEDLPILSITMRSGIVFQKDRFSKQIASGDTSTYKVVNNGQLVIAFPIDEGLIYTQDIVKKGIMSPAYNIWDVDYTNLDRRFLVMYLHSSFAMNYYKSKLKGTTQRRRALSKDDLLSMPLVVPPLPTQQSIVSELDSLSQIIADCKETLKDYDALEQSIFYDMFGDPVKNDKGWEVKKIEDVYSLKAGKTIKANELSEEPSEGLYPCFGGNGIRGYIAKKSHCGSYPIIGRQGALCGNVNFAEGEFYATEHAVVVSNKIECNPLFSYFLLTNMKLERLAKGVAQPGLSVASVNEENSILPPLPLQQQFASKIEAIEKMKSETKQALQEAETLFNARMDYWFN